MKSKTIMTLLLLGVSLSACGSQTSDNSSPISSSGSSSSSTQESSSSSSSNSTTEDSALALALKDIKTGYDSILSYRGSYGSGTDYTWESITNQQVLKSHEYFAYRDVSLDLDGSVSLTSQLNRFTILEADESGKIYRKVLSASNEAVDDYNDPSYSGKRFEPVYYNPFSFLSVDDFTMEGDQYHIPEAQAIAIAGQFGVSMTSFVSRSFDCAYFTMEDGEFSTFVFNYLDEDDSDNTLRFNFSLTFNETGEDIQHPEITPISDDGTDKSALEEAFDKVSGDNFTLTFTLTPGTFGMTSGRKYRFYFDGARIFAYSDLYYSTPSLAGGDLLFTPNDDGTMALSVYNSDSKSFVVSNESYGTYEEQKPALAEISMAMLTNLSGTYCANVTGGDDGELAYRALFNSFIPSVLHSDTMKYNANSLSITIDDNGYPSVTETFFYDIGGDGSFGENETVTVTYSNVGTTTLPSEVTNLIGD